jgi:hypothetical protein
LSGSGTMRSADSRKSVIESDRDIQQRRVRVDAEHAMLDVVGVQIDDQVLRPFYSR